MYLHSYQNKIVSLRVLKIYLFKIHEPALNKGEIRKIVFGLHIILEGLHQLIIQKSQVVAQLAAGTYILQLKKNHFI